MPQRIRQSAIILRSFAKTPDLLPEITKRAQESTRKALSLRVGGESAFAKVLFVVPRDYDCGETEKALHSALNAQGLAATVLSVGGHHSCGALNEALRWCAQNKMDRAFIVSNKAMGFLSDAAVTKMTQAIDAGMKVIGVHIPSLSDVAESPIQNTLAAWDLEALLAVGGFDCETGVEEVAPIIRLLQEFGKGSAAVIAGPSNATLDVRQSADGQARHAEVKKTKSSAQEAEAARLGVSLDWVKESIVTL